MRDVLITLIVFWLLLKAIKRPVIGIHVFTWISLMNPHRLTYGFAFDFPFAAILAGATTLLSFTTKEPKKLPMTPVTVTLLVFLAWSTLTSLFALEPDLAWGEWGRVSKTFYMVFLSMMLINHVRDVKIFTIIVTFSVGIFGIKGGLFTLLSGGSARVYGPSGSYLEENNGMALALVTILPLVWYLRSQVHKKWQIVVLTVAMGLMSVSVVGSYSRGALIGGCAMLFFLWGHSNKKGQTAIILISVMILIAMVMPSAWFERMNTINSYKQDDSAMGRVNAWQFAMNVASHIPIGGGYKVFTPRMFILYAPEPYSYHVAHSIWFQVLGEHGYFGLLLFILLMLFTWRTGTRVRKYCDTQAELKWAADLARMCQVALIGYAVSGTFLSLAYFDLYYDIIVILVCLEKILLPSKQTVPSLQAASTQPGHLTHGTNRQAS